MNRGWETWPRGSESVEEKSPSETPGKVVVPVGEVSDSGGEEAKRKRWEGGGSCGKRAWGY